jgi:hypothetical protein
MPWCFWTKGGVAHALLLDDDTIRGWRKLFEQRGIEGLTSFDVGGSASYLTAKQEIDLTAWAGAALPRSTRQIGTGLSFLIGATAHAMLPAAACMGAAQPAIDDCCVKMAMKDHATPAPMKQVPCKGISLDCAKQMDCISLPALPAPSTALRSPTAQYAALLRPVRARDRRRAHP